MSEKLFSLRKRVAKLEQHVADRARREKLANCNCEYSTIVVAERAEEFEAEMNLPCPAHGFRQLGRIVHIVLVSAGERPAYSSRIDQLIATYEARRTHQARLELEDDDSEDLNPRCKALTKSGKPCRAAATAGGLCFFHANPNKRLSWAELGEKAIARL